MTAPVFSELAGQEAVTEQLQTAATRLDCSAAFAGEMSGSMPEPEVVTASTGMAPICSPGLYGRSSFRIDWASSVAIMLRQTIHVFESCLCSWNLTILNLVLNREIVPELIQQHGRPERLAVELPTQDPRQPVAASRRAALQAE